MVRDASALGIGGDVVDLVLEILGVADAVFVERGLPDLSAELRFDGVGESAFDALDAERQCLCR